MACNNSDEEEVSKIAYKIFGTSNYKSMLDILPAYDGMVKEFNKKIKKLEKGKGDL